MSCLINICGYAFAGCRGITTLTLPLPFTDPLTHSLTHSLAHSPFPQTMDVCTGDVIMFDSQILHASGAKGCLGLSKYGI